MAAFVATLPLRKIPGIGEKSAERLAAVGLQTCADVQAFSPYELVRQFGKTGQMLLQRSQGLDDRPVESSRIRKSVGVETTLAVDLQQLPQAASVMQQLLPDLLRRVQRHCPLASLVRQGVKLKFADFQQTTVERSVSGWHPELWPRLLQEAWLRGEGRAVRLVGISVGLPGVSDEANPQLSLNL